MGQQEPLRVLVAEDELIVGYDLCDTVSEAGYIVEGPFDDLSSAMLAYQKTKPDIAILDVQLGDGIVYPLAEQMMAENVPVIFHSGQLTPEEVSRRFPNAQALHKPCPPADVIHSVQRAAAEF